MNFEHDKINMNSSPNHSFKEEENLFKGSGFSPEKNESNGNKQSLISSDFIAKESNSEVPSKSDFKIPFEDPSGLGNCINQPELKTCTEQEVPGDLGVKEGSDTIPKLPETTILLDTQWGSKVYVVGTAHFSEESQKDVAEVIRTVRPNVVVLELCTSRSYMLKWEEDEILKMAEKMEFKMVKETIQKYGALQGVLYLLLLSVSADVTREMGMAPGGEFRRAFKEAMNVPGCTVHLGDRPLEITLRRAFASLTWWQAIKFACYALFSEKKIDEKDIEKFKNQDYLEEMLRCFGGEFPELKKVFVNERDVFLSVSLLNAALSTRGPDGVYPNTVVGVVGMGHLRGIQEKWGKVDPEEFQRSLEVPRPSKVLKVLKFTIKTSFLCLALYGAHRLASRWESYSALFR